MRRPDAVLVAIPGIVLGGATLERAIRALSLNSAPTLEWVQFTVLGFALAFVLILHEALYRPQVE
ncbi:hypothetical protein [Haloarchaeobius sp. TZWWS8]|uniref:hypothetical protein n=1 Tax=Haloarchaeobius sp. TZWWS8 TaxID=3446121 RepID=UPI003EBFB46A